MARETRPWDAADTLRNKEDVAAYLDAILEDGDPELLKATSIYWCQLQQDALCLLTRDSWEDIERAGIRDLVLDACDERGLKGVLWAMRSHGLAIAGVCPGHSLPSF